MRLQNPRSQQLLVLAFLVFASVAGCGPRTDHSAPSGESERFTDHGTAVPIAGSRGIVATRDGEGLPRILVWPRDHNGVGSLLAINAVNGEIRQVDTPDGKHESSPFAILLSSENRFYSQFNSSFYEFSADRLEFTFSADVESPFAMSLTEAPDGTIWSAGYPDSRLYSYDPGTQELVRYGSINEEDWRQYPRSLAADSSGWIYIGIGITRGQIVAFNPDTRERRPIFEEAKRSHGTAEVFRGTNGKVYGRAPEDGPWYELYRGNAERIDEPPVEEVEIKKGTQGAVYREFPGGRYLEEINLPDKWAEIRSPNSETTERIKFDYESDGALVQSLIAGPNDAIYGSTALPLRFFRFDSGTGEYRYRSLPGGQVNTFDVQDETLYLAIYPRGVLYEYDPSAEWNPGDGASSNPERLFQSSPTIHRPHAVLAHTDGRLVIFGGTPDYGKTGGGMVIYDRATQDTTMLTDEALLPEHSVRSLASLPDGNVLVGTTISPGTGGETLADEARLYAIDPRTHEILYDEVVVPDAREIRGLEVGPDGLVYGFARPATFFVFDPESRDVVRREKLDDYGDVAGYQGSRVLETGPGGNLYALFRDAIVQITPSTFEHRKIADPPVEVHAGFGLREGRLYFSHGSSIWSYELSDDADGE